jgi:hypothetical protein
MRVEARQKFGQNISQSRPHAVGVCAVYGVVKGFGVAKIGVDQAGKNHPPEHGEAEGQVFPGLGGRNADPVGREALRDRRDLLSPDGIEDAGIVLRQSRVQTARFADAVWQTRVMPRNGVGDQLADHPVETGGAPQDFSGACRGMVDGSRAASQTRLKCGRVFAQIMQQPRRAGRRLDAERAAELRRQIRHRVEVLP